MTRFEIAQLVRECLVAVNSERPASDKIEINEDTLLLDDNSSLDSLEFVSFSTDLEGKLAKRTGRAFALAADALANESEAYRSVRSLTDHLATRLGT